MSARHEVPTGDEDLANQRASRAKDGDVDHVVGQCTAKRRRIAVEGHQIGERAGGDPATVSTQRCRPAGERPLPERAADPLARGGEHVASMRPKPLTVFQQSQFLERIGRHVAVGADADPPAGAQVVLRGEGTQQLVVKVQGSGDVDAKQLEAKQGTFTLQGSGEILTRLGGGHAQFEISDAGEIHWWGEAKVQTQIKDGKGKVVHEPDPE